MCCNYFNAREQSILSFFSDNTEYIYPGIPVFPAFSQVTMTELGTLSKVMGLETGTVPVAVICIGTRCCDYSLWFVVEHYKIFLSEVITEQLS